MTDRIGQDKKEEIKIKIDQLPHQALTHKILGCAFDLMNELGQGFLEAVYRGGLVHLIKKQGLLVEHEVSIPVFFQGEKIGQYYADLFVERSVIVELKCCSVLIAEHQAQLINYLRATGVDTGLLINFGNRTVEYKRLYNPLLQHIQN